MSCKLGFLSSDSNDMQSVNIIKQDIPSESEYEMKRCGDGDLQSVTYSEKAQIHLEADHLTNANLGAIRKVLSNRVNPHKLFIKHPADSNHEYIFDTGINRAYHQQSDDSDKTSFDYLTDGFDNAEVTNINTWDLNTVDENGTLKYVYFLFTADISNYVTNYAVNTITRITLAMKDLFLTDEQSTGDKGIGFKVDYYDNALLQYVEIKRQGITVDADNVLYASIRPIDCFTNFDNALSSNLVKFRIRNLYENRVSGGAISAQIAYAKIFVNGYGCVWDNVDNFTYRDTYTGNGWTGSLDLHEL